MKKKNGMMKKSIFVLFALILTSMIFIACGSKEKSDETVEAETIVEKLEEKGKSGEEQTDLSASIDETTTDIWGMCGQDLNWYLQNNILVIRGDGEMNFMSPPWDAYDEDIFFIVIEEGCTLIEEFAFSRCINVMEVTIPGSVKTIGEMAFDECINMTSVQMGEGIETIGRCAFSGCDNLSSVEIPNSVTVIEVGAFGGCINLESIEIPDGVTVIDGICKDCDNLSSVVLPEGITTIGRNAFWSCDNLCEINIPNSVTSIEDGAFGCTGLKSITISNNITNIGSSAFKLTSLVEIDIPDSVESIGDGAFWGCEQLQKVTVHNSETVIGENDVFPVGTTVVIGGKEQIWE